MATEQITDDELLALRVLANTRGGVKLGSSVLLRLLNTVDALRRQLEERTNCAPEFDVNKLDGLEGAWRGGDLRNYIAGARAGWEKCASLVRAPSTDVVTVPREYLEMLQSAANRFCSSCRDNNETCTMTSRHFGGTGCGAWKLDGTRINALRSGDAGKDAT